MTVHTVHPFSPPGTPYTWPHGGTFVYITTTTDVAHLQRRVAELEERLAELEETMAERMRP